MSKNIMIKIRADLGDVEIPSALNNGMTYSSRQINGGILIDQDDDTGDVLAILPTFEYAQLNSIDLDFIYIEKGV